MTSGRRWMVLMPILCAAGLRAALFIGSGAICDRCLALSPGRLGSGRRRTPKRRKLGLCKTWPLRSNLLLRSDRIRQQHRINRHNDTTTVLQKEEQSQKRPSC